MVYNQPSTTTQTSNQETPKPQQHDRSTRAKPVEGIIFIYANTEKVVL